MVSSETNKLVGIDPVSGNFTRPVAIENVARMDSPGQDRWPTDIKLCPQNGDFYVSQYAVRHSACACSYALITLCKTWQPDKMRAVACMQGKSVLRFDGRTLQFKRIAAVMPKKATSPEGLCFSKSCMYVAR